MHPLSGSLQEEVFRKLYGTGFVTAKNPSAPSRQVSASHELFAHLLLSPGVTCTVSHQVIESVEMLQLQKKQKQEEQVRKEEAKKTMTSASAKSHSSNSSFLSVSSGSESDFQLFFVQENTLGNICAGFFDAFKHADRDAHEGRQAPHHSHLPVRHARYQVRNIIIQPYRAVSRNRMCSVSQ